MRVTPQYFSRGKVIAESGDVRVYEFGKDLFLDKGISHFLWARASELREYESQIKNYPKGNCLEIGLGLGVSAKYILTQPRTEYLTTVETNPDVINVFFKLNQEGLGRHKIILGDGIDFLIKTEETFDFVFLDFYSLIDEDTLPQITLAVRLAKFKLNREGKIVAWFDPFTPEEFALPFFDLFKEE
jgi:predicted membrane-bound spermidine synthase